MAVNPVLNRLGTADTYRLRSPNLWSDCRFEEYLARQSDGIAFYDDFTDIPLAPTLTTQIAYGKYKAFASSGSGIQRVSQVNSTNVPGGVLRLATRNDNDSVSLATAYQMMSFSGLPATSGKIWFECQLAQNTISANTQGLFVGLAETSLWTLATGVPFNGGSGTITNAAAGIGHYIDENGQGVTQTVYTDRATSWTVIKSTASTITANTFRKFGIKYDPSNQTRMVTFWVDGVELNDALTYTTLNGTTNLKAALLAPMISVVAAASGTTADCFVKWWAWANQISA